MSREALLALLHGRLGLDEASLGARVVDDACADARRRLGVADDAALVRRVLLDADAFAECAECFVVPESWFFRAAEQFDDLVRFAREQPQRRPLRVLSLPSASGEEAFSAAMALLDAGVPVNAIDVLGIDVSREAVGRAKEGVFRRSALRGRAVPGSWLHEDEDGTLRIDPMLQRCVRFRVGNALDPNLLADEAPFDAVFCRNLLIYLHPDARRRMLRILLDALATPGLVLAGQAEVLTGLSDRLQPWQGASPLTYLHGPVAAKPARVAEPSPPWFAPPAATAAPAPSIRSDAVAPRGRGRGVETPAAAATTDPIADARRLADAGHVEQARAECLAHLARTPADIAALFLLGLLESAAGDTEAADRAFARVLYLDHEHIDALEQRIGLAERRGAGTQANDLRARATRLRRRRDQRGATP